MRKRSRNLSEKKVERVRKLRKSMSISEKLLWDRLRNYQTGFLFRRQHPMGDYCLDFYCAEAFLNVEVDGEQHSRTKFWDSRRDAKLMEQGILVLRIPSIDLFDPRSSVSGKWLRLIQEKCEERTERKGFEPY
jgi:very-short-patch-repair endonuclease